MIAKRTYAKTSCPAKKTSKLYAQAAKYCMMLRLF